MTDTERSEHGIAAENELYNAEADVTDTVEAEADAQSTDEGGAQNESTAASPIDYEALAREDAEILASTFPSLRGITSVAELKNPLRYAALRDLGLSPKEAYLATCEPTAAYDNRSHLFSTAQGKRGSAETQMTRSELEAARELFAGLSDREIHSLYKKVTK